MIPLPPAAPATGLSQRIRLDRDYVQVDAADYYVDPRFTGRLVDVTASPDAVTVRCDGQVIAPAPVLDQARRRHLSRVPGRGARGASQARRAIGAGLA